MGDLRSVLVGDGCQPDGRHLDDFVAFADAYDSLHATDFGKFRLERICQAAGRSSFTLSRTRSYCLSFFSHKPRSIHRYRSARGCDAGVIGASAFVLHEFLKKQVFALDRA